MRRSCSNGAYLRAREVDAHDETGPLATVRTYEGVVHPTIPWNKTSEHHHLLFGARTVEHLESVDFLPCITADLLQSRLGKPTAIWPCLLERSKCTKHLLTAASPLPALLRTFAHICYDIFLGPLSHEWATLAGLVCNSSCPFPRVF